MAALPKYLDINLGTGEISVTYKPDKGEGGVIGSIKLGPDGSITVGQGGAVASGVGTQI